MTHWNYRVIRKEEESPSGEMIAFFEIHEVYYDEEGAIEAWTKRAVRPYAEDSSEGLKTDLELMSRALDKPVLVIIEEEENEKLVEWDGEAGSGEGAETG